MYRHSGAIVLRKRDKKKAKSREWPEEEERERKSREERKVSRTKTKKGRRVWAPRLCVPLKAHLSTRNPAVEIFFLVVFVLEVAVKLAGLGPKQYFRSKFNW